MAYVHICWNRSLLRDINRARGAKLVVYQKIGVTRRCLRAAIAHSMSTRQIRPGQRPSHIEVKRTLQLLQHQSCFHICHELDVDHNPSRNSSPQMPSSKKAAALNTSPVVSIHMQTISDPTKYSPPISHNFNDLSSKKMDSAKT